MFKWWTKISLPNRILIFIVIGIVLGLILGPHAEKIKFIGDIFVNFIKMMVLFLVIPALITGGKAAFHSVRGHLQRCRLDCPQG
ncbi:hypothetical protein ES703_42734 [subsurface metagenome]